MVVFILNQFTIKVNFGHDSGIVGHFFYHGGVQSRSLANDSWREKACKFGICNIFGVPSYVLELALHENFRWLGLKNGFVRVDISSILIWLSPDINVVLFPISDGNELVPRGQNSTEGKIGAQNKGLLKNCIKGAVSKSHVEEQHSEGALLHNRPQVVVKATPWLIDVDICLIQRKQGLKLILSSVWTRKHVNFVVRAIVVKDTRTGSLQQESEKVNRGTSSIRLNGLHKWSRERLASKFKTASHRSSKVLLVLVHRLSNG